MVVQWCKKHSDWTPIPEQLN